MSTEGRFGEFLRESFAALAGEMPELYRRLCATLAPRQVRLQVGAEDIGLEFAADRVRFVACGPAPAVELRTTRAVILDLVDARTALVEAVLDDRLGFRGALPELACFHDGLMLYLHGAMRAPSFPGLLRRYRHGG